MAGVVVADYQWMMMMMMEVACPFAISKLDLIHDLPYCVGHSLEL
jgi:hypothetical protein